MTGWQDAHSEQMALWRFVRSDLGQRVIREWAAAEVQGQPLKTVVYASMIEAEADKLRGADPIFIAAEMSDLIDAARETFKPEAFVETDVLTDNGFVYFEKPLALIDRSKKTVSLGAFSWQPIVSSDEDDHRRGLAISFYSTADAEWDDFHVEHRRWMLQVGAPKLTLLHLAPVWFDLDFSGELVDADTGLYTGADSWWKAIQVTLRLMQQTIATRESMQLPRGERRRMERADLLVRPVVVVKLRRSREHKETESEKNVEWSHRWIVGGHWRNQFFPTLKAHRQVWISPYVKGPDEKPLIVKRHAFELVR